MKRAMLCAFVVLSSGTAAAGEIYDWRASASADPFDTDANTLCGGLATQIAEVNDRITRADSNAAVENRLLRDAEADASANRRLLAGQTAVAVNGAFVPVAEHLAVLDAVSVRHRTALADAQSDSASSRKLLAAIEDERKQCQAEAKRRVSERLASLSGKSKDDLDAIPRGDLLPQERERLGAFREASRALAAEEKEARERDPALMGPVLSAAICFERSERHGTMTEIATQKKYARIGGSIDRTQIYRLQGYLRDHDETIADYTSQLRAMHAKPLPCGATVVKTLLACATDGKQPRCAADRVPLMLSLMPDLVSDDDASLTYDFRNKDPDRVWVKFKRGFEDLLPKE